LQHFIKPNTTNCSVRLCSEFGHRNDFAAC
jgi:hypothetical protein